jgi:hypothetical protein
VLAGATLIPIFEYYVGLSVTSFLQRYQGMANEVRRILFILSTLCVTMACDGLYSERTRKIVQVYERGQQQRCGTLTGVAAGNHDDIQGYDMCALQHVLLHHTCSQFT